MNDSKIESAFICGVGFVLMAVMVFTGYYTFCFLQEALLMKSGDVVLLHNRYIVFVVGILAMIISMNIGFRTVWKHLCYDRITLFIIKIKASHFALASLVAALIILLPFFFNYAIVAKDGVRYRGMFQVEKVYCWKDIKNARTYYTVSQGKLGNHYKFHYAIDTTDGKSFDIRNARDFWFKLEDFHNVVMDSNIKFVKCKVNMQIFNSLSSEYKDKNRSTYTFGQETSIFNELFEVEE